MGLKAAYSPNRNFAAKGYIPRDLDGAYRVAGRLDGRKPDEVYKNALVEDLRLLAAKFPVAFAGGASRAPACRGA